MINMEEKQRPDNNTLQTMKRIKDKNNATLVYINPVTGMRINLGCFEIKDYKISRGMALLFLLVSRLLSLSHNVERKVKPLLQKKFRWRMDGSFSPMHIPHRSDGNPEESVDNEKGEGVTLPFSMP